MGHSVLSGWGIKACARLSAANIQPKALPADLHELLLWQQLPHITHTYTITHTLQTLRGLVQWADLPKIVIPASASMITPDSTEYSYQKLSRMWFKANPMTGCSCSTACRAWGQTVCWLARVSPAPAAEPPVSADCENSQLVLKRQYALHSLIYILPISLIFLLVICVPCPRSYCSLCHVNLYVLLLLLLTDVTSY